MANKSIFGSQRGVVNAPAANTTNRAGGAAFALDAKHTLAQLAATNCFNGTFYASAGDNLALAKQAVEQVKGDPEFIAKVAVYAREKAYMKDMPAYLVAYLACLDDGKKPPYNNRELFRRTFRRVIDNGKMLRAFVQIGRSGQAGKILNMTSGTCRAAINEWFLAKSPRAIFKAAVGNDPSLQNILRMSRPRPKAGSDKAALLSYLMTDLNNNRLDENSGKVDGNVFDTESRSFKQFRRDKSGTWRLAHEDPWDNLPPLIRHYEEFRRTKTGPVPDVEFRLLTDLGLTTQQWAEIARKAPWTMTRMNLNTFGRQGVFADPELVRIVADRLRNPEEIANGKVFPYQILAAYRAIVPSQRTGYSWMSYGTKTRNQENLEIPMDIQEALHDAMEIAVGNVPVMERLKHIAIDVSGSMSGPVTGHREGATSNVRCIDVASLFATAAVRKNKSTKVYPFDHSIHAYRPEPRNTVLTEANRLAEFGGGATNCGLVLQELNIRGESGDVMFISDNESWVSGQYGGNSTLMMNEWVRYAGRNPGARLVCLDITPRDNAQVVPRSDILQVGGFSDKVFDVVKSFLEAGGNDDHWVKLIEEVQV